MGNWQMWQDINAAFTACVCPTFAQQLMTCMRGILLRTVLSRNSRHEPHVGANLIAPFAEKLSDD